MLWNVIAYNLGGYKSWKFSKFLEFPMYFRGIQNTPPKTNKQSRSRTREWILIVKKERITEGIRKRERKWERKKERKNERKKYRKIERKKER